MITGLELSQPIGQSGLLVYPDGMKFAVRITNTKSVFGRTLYQIEAIGGHGSVWVAAERVQLGDLK